MRYILTVKYPWAIERNEVLRHATRLTNLKNIYVEWEKPDVRDNIQNDFVYLKRSRKGKFTETETCLIVTTQAWHLCAISAPWHLPTRPLTSSKPLRERVSRMGPLVRWSPVHFCNHGKWQPITLAVFYCPETIRPHPHSREGDCRGHELQGVRSLGPPQIVHRKCQLKYNSWMCCKMAE